MMNIFFELYQNRMIADVRSTANAADGKASSAQENFKMLERRAELSILLNQALFEIVSEKLGVSEGEILAKIEEIDLRDGLHDGKVGSSPLKKCENCRRSYNIKFNKCLYCGFVEENSEALIIDKYQ